MDPRLLAMVDGTSLELVDDLVDAGPMGLCGRVGPQRLAVDDEGDLDDVRDRGAAMLLVRKLDKGVAPIVEEALQPPELELGLPADIFGHVDDLALDDRPHGDLPEAGLPLARSRFEMLRGRRDGRAAVVRVYTRT
jgi:hypothetical protein